VEPLVHPLRRLDDFAARRLPVHAVDARPPEPQAQLARRAVAAGRRNGESAPVAAAQRKGEVGWS
jgi:hypothetical protein